MSEESFIRLPPDGTGKMTRAIRIPERNVYQTVNIVRDIEAANPVYVATVLDSTSAVGKHHIALWNGSDRYVRILEIIVVTYISAQETNESVPLVVQRASSVLGGTTVPIEALDPRAPPLPLQIMAMTNPTVIPSGNPIMVLSMNSILNTVGYLDFRPITPIVIAPNKGLSLRQHIATRREVRVAISLLFSNEIITP